MLYQIVKSGQKQTKAVIKILAVVLLFCTYDLAQQLPTDLFLLTPLSSELTAEGPRQFRINLLAGQTATVEADQSEADVTLTAFDPSGSKLVEWGLPLGRVGKETILVIAETTGEYRVEVSAGNRHAFVGKFVIQVNEIRPTTDEDRVKTRAAIEMIDLMGQVDKLKDDETVASYRKVIEIWQKVVELAKVKKDRTAEARALHSMGNVLLDFGEIQQSLDVNLRVLQMWRDQNNRRMELVAAGRIANVWYQAGEYEKALAVNKEVLSIATEIGSRSNEATALGNIGSSYLYLGQPEAAIEHLDRSLAILAESRSLLFQPPIMQSLGQAYIAQGNYVKGTKYLEDALDLQEKVGYRIDSPPFYLILGRVYLETGQTEKAFSLFQSANELADQTGTKRYQVQSLYYLALVEKSRGNLEKAVEHLEGGLKLIEKIRGEIRNKDLRTGYFSNVQDLYELYIDLLVERAGKTNKTQDVAAAFEMSERSRSRSLLDLLYEARVDLNSGISDKLIEEQKDLIDEINNKYRVRESLQTSRSTLGEIEKINAEISDLEIRSETLNVEIGQKNPRLADLRNAKPRSVRDIQALLDDETVLLEYKLGKERSFLWLVGTNSIEVHLLPKRKVIEERAKSFYDTVVANSKVKRSKLSEISRDLGDILLSPVSEKIVGKRVAVVADGVLQYIPYSALPSPIAKDRSLIETNEVVVLPSAAVLAQLRSNPKNSNPDNKTIGIFADPVFDIEDARIRKNSKPIETNSVIAEVLRDFRFGKTLPRLLASRQEAANIANLVKKNNVSVRMDFQASLANIEQADLKGYKILHFATHGLLNSSRPELSGLVFSLYDKNGQDQDGFLTLNDIYNLDLSSDLVVLSACQTALGKDVRGEGLIGLSRGFLYAGSNRIIASLWKVDDSATAEFMERFYTNHLQKKMSVSQAMRQTKIEMQQIPRYRSPYYWSAYTMLGDWK